MSRLHTILKKGVDNVLLPKNMRTENCQTVGDRLVQLTGDHSPRMGNRDRTKLKTARACGSNATPTMSWGARKQGESGKAWQVNNRRALVAQAKKARMGDR